MTGAPPTADPLDAPATLDVELLRGRARTVFAALYVLAVAVTAVAVFSTAAGSRAHDLTSSSGAMLAVLAADVVLIVGLAAVAGWRARSLLGERVRDAGVRLHRRFIGLFALAAVVPAIIVAVFFGLLVTRGVESWFSARVRTAVEDSARVARSYLRQQEDNTRNALTPVADDLNRAAPYFAQSRLGFGRLLLEEVASRDLLAVYVIDAEGRVLARAEQPGAPGYLAPPPDMMRGAPRDALLRLDSADLARAVFKLAGYTDAYVYVVRPLGAGVMAQLRRTSDAVNAYREAEAARGRIQAVFVLAYVATALLVLIGAVWVGVALAAQIATPVARLVQAAGRAASGDLSARVDDGRQPQEIAVLSRAFNRMTTDLQSQQEALRTAGTEAQSRSRFIEAVLSGVSAGVVGLDVEGRISVLNDRAAMLLGLQEGAAGGRLLAEAAPELSQLIDRAARIGEAEGDVDVERGTEARRLRVRAAGGRGAGLVLTFDDMTRLLAAQRSAAWRDVARRIAHEIKNPLTPIQLSAERLKRRYRAGVPEADLETFDRCTDTIVRQVADIGRMVDEFSAFARMPEPKFAEEDLAELIRQAAFAQRVAYPDVGLDLAEPEGVVVTADGRMVAQALANILKNAGEAVAARVAADPEPAGRIRVALERRPSGEAVVVEDNGVGLPSRDRARLTEPYVTTREKGTGLGLAIVKRIMEEHGGELWLGDAEQGRGARVELRFPKGAAKAAPAKSKDERSAMAAAE